MTALPTAADFPTNSPAPKAKQQQLLDALNERFPSYAPTASRVAVANPGGSSLVSASAANPASFGGGEVSDFVTRHGFFGVGTYGVVSNSVALSVLDGVLLSVTLNASVNADGFSLSDLGSSGWSGLLWISQDGTGGRTIGGGSTVNAGFPSASFDFCGYTIALPSAASKSVVCLMLYRGTGKVLVLPFATPS